MGHSYHAKQGFARGSGSGCAEQQSNVSKAIPVKQGVGCVSFILSFVRLIVGIDDLKGLS